MSFPFKKADKKRKLTAMLFLLAIALLSSLLLSPSALTASGAGEEAGGKEAAMEELEKNIGDLLDALDTSELEQYLETLTEWKGTNLKEKLAGLITGDYALDYSSLASSVLALVLDDCKLMLPAFAVVLAVALLCGILNSAKSGFMNSTMSDIINFVGFLSVGAVTLACLIDVLETGFGAISAMKRQMEIIYPILFTLMAASGGNVSAAIYRPSLVFMSGTIVELFSGVVLPTSVAVVVLAFVGNLSGEVRTERLGDLFKSFNKWIIGLTLGIFSLFLTIQGITAAQYDGISLRAVRYVLSGSVPLVGGFLSGGLDLVLAGSALIKNAVGSFSLLLLFGTLLRPVVLFAAFQLFLRLAAAATEPVGGKISPFLSRLAGDCGYFLAGLLCIGFLYFLTVLLLICSTGAIF